MVITVEIGQSAGKVPKAHHKMVCYGTPSTTARVSVAAALLFEQGDGGLRYSLVPPERVQSSPQGALDQGP